MLAISDIDPKRIATAMIGTCFLLIALPSLASASSIVWGDQSGGTPTLIEISDGGAYSVPLNTPAPAYITYPQFTPDGKFVFNPQGMLFRLVNAGDTTEREYVATLYEHTFDDPDNPDDFPDVSLAWPAAGSYELDIVSFPPPEVSFNDELLRWLASLLFADIAHAQFGEPIFIESIHFTIEEASSELTPVVIIPGILGSAQHNGEWLIDPITHAYDNLIDTLAANGYERGVTLFPFPYEWRFSNRTTATLLNAKIDEIKTICGCDKVDIVAHSMGGLVARQYIQSDDYDQDVRKLIFLGTPHLGAPKAYLMWEGGENDTDRQDQRIKMFLRIEARRHGFGSLFDYVRKTPIPSAQELLPVYGYIKHVGSQDIPLFPKSDWYPSNLFLSVLNNDLEDLVNSGVAISNIVGRLSASTTIETIRVIAPSIVNASLKWGFGFPEGFFASSGDHGLERGLGDGTVPLSSSSFVTEDLQLFDSEHSDLPTATQSVVFRKLTGRDPHTLVVDKSRLDVPVLILQILSPADFVVVAPNGLKIGKDFVTGGEFNQIPDAFYSGFGTDEEYVTIPSPLHGIYKVITQGTGNGGIYTIATGMIGDATSGEAFFTGQTLPNLLTEHDIDVSPDQPDQTTITPSDQAPPAITFIQPSSATYTRSDNLPVRITFNDATGIASSSVAFDSHPIAASSTIDLFFQSLGSHTISAYAKDLVNNATTSTKKIQVIATIHSTLSDINRAFTLGWIKTASARDTLGIMLTQAQKLNRQGDRIKLYKAVLGTLKAFKKAGIINQQAHDLLASDVTWVINH